MPKGQDLKEVMLAVKNVASPPQVVGVTWKNYNLLIKELPNIEDKKKAKVKMIDSFQGLKKWDISIILTSEGQIKSIEEWKQCF